MLKSSHQQLPTDASKIFNQIQDLIVTVCAQVFPKLI